MTNYNWLQTKEVELMLPSHNYLALTIPSDLVFFLFCPIFPAISFNLFGGTDTDPSHDTS